MSFVGAGRRHETLDSETNDMVTQSNNSRVSIFSSTDSLISSTDCPSSHRVTRRGTDGTCSGFHYRSGTESLGNLIFIMGIACLPFVPKGDTICLPILFAIYISLNKLPGQRHSVSLLPRYAKMVKTHV